MEQTAGKQSISFTEPVHIISSASVVGPKEGEGPLGDGFDLIAPEADFGEEHGSRRRARCSRRRFSWRLERRD